MFNEFVIDLITINLFVYTDWVDNPHVKYDVAWVSIALFIILITFNFGKFILQGLNYLKLIAIKVYNRANHDYKKW